MICSKDDAGDCCGKCFNPVVLIATHERIDITEKNIKSLFKQTVVPKIVLVVSKQDELEYFKKLPITVVMKPNKPLGGKWQGGVAEAARFDPDPLIILGSDDILHPEYIDHVLGLMRNGFDMVGSTSWYTYSKREDSMLKCQYINRNKDFPIGSGKAIRLRLLYKMRWKVFSADVDRHLDDNSYKRAIGEGANIYLIREPMVLAYKGNWGTMNNAHGYLRSPNIKCETVGKDILNQFLCAESRGQ